MSNSDDELLNNKLDYNELPGGPTGGEGGNQPQPDKFIGGGGDPRPRRTWAQVFKGLVPQRLRRKQEEKQLGEVRNELADVTNTIEGRREDVIPASPEAKNDLLRLIKEKLEGSGRYRLGDIDYVISTFGPSDPQTTVDGRKLAARVIKGKQRDLNSDVTTFELTTGKGDDGALDLDAYTNYANKPKPPALLRGNPLGNNRQIYEKAQQDKLDARLLAKSSGLSTVSEVDAQQLLTDLRSDDLKLAP